MWNGQREGVEESQIILNIIFICFSDMFITSVISYDNQRASEFNVSTKMGLIFLTKSRERVKRQDK